MPVAAKASQEFVKIKEIRDGIVILKDGGLRAVLMASSINFALKSEDNQEAIIAQFQDFLNTLDFSVQIVVQSRRFDVKPYLATLEARAVNQTNELLKIQTREYIGFVQKFTENTNIMNKLFFIVVPYSAAILQVKSGAEGFSMKVKESIGVGGKKHPGESKGFEESKAQLEQRVSVVQQGLIRTGVRVAQLGTEEVVDLFYQLFNPGEAEKSIATK